MDAGSEQNPLSSDALLRQMSSSIMNSPEFNIARRPEMVRTQQLDGWPQLDGKPHVYNTRNSGANPVAVTPNPARTVAPASGPWSGLMGPNQVTIRGLGRGQTPGRPRANLSAVAIPRARRARARTRGVRSLGPYDRLRTWHRHGNTGFSGAPA